jgi:hypothetical protein
MSIENYLFDSGKSSFKKSFSVLESITLKRIS